MSIMQKIPSLPVPSTVMVREEFIRATGIAPDHLEELLGLGWLEASADGSRQRLFRDTDIYRVRKLERICCDFDLPVLGGTIIVDLLERIDTLERLVQRLRRFEED
ncbi:MAG: MerR family transcriptional regulator [Desulfovibrio sp.]|nr:MerR family transcriptional regulator [Desulfovibrio sp.]